MKALTLFELIMSIVIFAIIIIPLMQIFATVSHDSTEAIFINHANIIGQSVLELITSKYFDENNNPPWTDPEDLGPDPGEISLDQYDDVDDFAGYRQNSIPGSPGFSYSVHVYYVDPDVSWNSQVNEIKNYKRIDVIVSHAQMGELIFSSAVSAEGHKR